MVMWQRMFSMPVMRTVWGREPAHASTQYALQKIEDRNMLECSPEVF